MFLREFFKKVLCESLSKGSNTVLANKKLVANLADTIRDDAEMNPRTFGNNARTLGRADDITAVTWFLENLDRMEEEGYEGTRSTRDGVNNLWIATRYAEGKDTWEDLTGKLQPTIHDYYLLKNRNLLDANHKDIMKFHSVRELSYYMSTHYAEKLKDLREKAMLNARYKSKKVIKLVDNEDYLILIILNRSAACAYGLGSSWCTSMSHYDGHFHSYSNRAMLFNLFPKNPEVKTVSINNQQVESVEKYQFDAGGPNFMDVADRPVNRDLIREKFPYLYTDITGELSKNKEKIEAALEHLSNDPQLSSSRDSQIKLYDIDQEIRKLSKFVQGGWMTTAERPEEEPEEENPEV